MTHEGKVPGYSRPVTSPRFEDVDAARPLPAVGDGVLSVLRVDAGLAARLSADPRALDAVGTAFRGRKPLLLQFDQGEERFFDPSVAIAVLLHRLPTAWFAIGTAALSETGHPYNLARRLASIEQLSRGRAAWVLADDDEDEAARDRVRVVHQLLRSWPRESIAQDAAASHFAQVDRIRRIGADGAYPTAGPLNVPSSPQYLPVFVSSAVFHDPHRYLDLRLRAGEWVLPTDGDRPSAVASGRSVRDLDDLIASAAALPFSTAEPRTLRARLGLPVPTLAELPGAHPRFAPDSAAEAS